MTKAHRGFKWGELARAIVRGLKWGELARAIVHLATGKNKKGVKEQGAD